MQELIKNILDNPWVSLGVVGNLIIIESLLSVDNAAVLATLVLDLKEEQRTTALRYGLIGAYVMRGTAMAFASFLLHFWYLKTIGGLYLLYLVVKFIRSKQGGEGGEDEIKKDNNWLFKATVGRIGKFWATVALVELMDMAFSIDNVFAAVAFSPNIILVCTGVFIGILAMRFVAQGFVKLMENFPFLETAAYVVIGILGVKLVSASLCHQYMRDSAMDKFLEGDLANLLTSAMTIGIFAIPLATSALFNFPRKAVKED
jgi:YkoY family integral membrane protein